MIINISQEKMKKVGELVFETFNEARKERKSRNLSILTATALVNDGIIPNREKIYAVWKGKVSEFEYYRAAFKYCVEMLPEDKRQRYIRKMMQIILEI